MSAYAPQTGCDEEEKTQFWEDLEEDLREIPESYRLEETSMATAGATTEERRIPSEYMELERATWQVIKSQIDYILCRMSDRGNVKDCKVILGESVTSQHRPLICTLGRSITPRRKIIGVQRTKWWKLADKDSQTQFVAAREKLQQSEREVNRSLEEVTEDLGKLGEILLGKTSGKCKPGKETWWNDVV
nr:uncharacterized protein LOC113825926 [Penaeus vannamei]